MKPGFFSVIILLLLQMQVANAQSLFDTDVMPADAKPEFYMHYLKNKNVALIINQTSVAGDSSLLDMLLSRHVAVKKIFVPEHGFRGVADAGAHIDNGIDSATKLPVISLYGAHKKPTAGDLEDIDIMVYDLQDVGVRFYTYISTLEYCMEACAENKKNFLVLDRPNPNGFYVDGPVLEKEQKSFVGMQCIPIVYGMTCGEYALMLAGERWFNNAKELELKVVKCLNYTHSKKYKLPVAPSPNLRNMAAIYAYPSLCLFEGTVISVGRGTDKPFQQYGHPELAGKFTYNFEPKSGLGAKNPPYENKVCYGEIAGDRPEEVLLLTGNKMYLNWLIKAYTAYPDKPKFFNGFFTKLSGTTDLEQAIKNNDSEAAITASWEIKIREFKKIRRKYLLYADFE